MPLQRPFSYPLLILGIAYLLWYFYYVNLYLITFRVQRWIVFVPWAIVCFITILSYFRDIGLRLTTEWRTIADYYNYFHNQVDTYTVNGSPHLSKPALKAHRAGLYVIPSKYDLFHQLNTAADLPFKAMHSIARNEEIKIEKVICGSSWLITEPQFQFPSSSGEGIYAVLSQGTHRYIFSTASIRNDRPDILRQRRYFKKGLETEVYDCYIPLTNARIMWLQGGNRPKLYHTNAVVSINP